MVLLNSLKCRLNFKLFGYFIWSKSVWWKQKREKNAFFSIFLFAFVSSFGMPSSHSRGGAENPGLNACCLNEQKKVFRFFFCLAIFCSSFTRIEGIQEKYKISEQNNLIVIFLGWQKGPSEKGLLCFFLKKMLYHAIREWYKWYKNYLMKIQWPLMYWITYNRPSRTL